MNNLAIRSELPSMSTESIGKVAVLEREILKMPQVHIDTAHLIHGGMYARTIMIPAGTVLTGALIKIPTILIAQGDAIVYIGNDTIELSGYSVLPASANRKQAFIAKTDTYLTMIFPSRVSNIKEAEHEFTDEAASLFSRNGVEKNHINITGE